MKFSNHVIVIISAMMGIFQGSAADDYGTDDFDAECVVAAADGRFDADAYMECKRSKWLRLCVDVVGGNNALPVSGGRYVGCSVANFGCRSGDQQRDRRCSRPPMRRVEVLDESSQFGVMLKCRNVSYKVALLALPGPHFLIGGFADDGDLNCPTLAFASLLGQKKVFSASFEGLAKHIFGTASLIDLRNAHDKVAVSDTATYSLEVQNCVHYAGSIWRELGFTETEDLASFLVDNIVQDPNLALMVKKNAGGLRTAAALVQGPTELKNLVEKQVHSQLRIQDMPGGDLTELRVVQDLPGGRRRLGILSPSDLYLMLEEDCLGGDFTVSLAIMANPAMIIQPIEGATQAGCKPFMLESFWESGGNHVVDVLEFLPPKEEETEVLNANHGSLYLLGTYTMDKIIVAFNKAVLTSAEDSTYDLVFNNAGELMAHFALGLGYESSEIETETIAELTLLAIPDLADRVRKDELVLENESLARALEDMTPDEVAFWFIERFTSTMYNTTD